jgi:hypothetical protein
MKTKQWFCKNGYAKVGDTLKFSEYNSVSGKPGETATIVGYIETKLLGDLVTIVFDDKTRCCSDKLWDAEIVSSNSNQR